MLRAEMEASRYHIAPCIALSSHSVLVSWFQPYNFWGGSDASVQLPHSPSLPVSTHQPRLFGALHNWMSRTGGRSLPGSVIDCSAAEQASLYLCRVYCFFHLRHNWVPSPCEICTVREADVCVQGIHRRGVYMGGLSDRLHNSVQQF